MAAGHARQCVLFILVFAPVLSFSTSAFLTYPSSFLPSSTRSAHLPILRPRRFSETITASCSVSRRDAVVAILAVAPNIAFMQSSTAAGAEAGKGEQAAEGIRKMASKLPGMGPSDVTYPDTMAGLWTVEKKLAGVDFPAGMNAADPAAAKQALENVNKVTTFSMKFIRNGESVVADRGFNTQQEIAATEGQDVSVLWKVSNPNVLTVTYPSGEVRERKVTRRSASGGGEEQGLEFSEYSRLATVSAQGGGSMPQIGARWVRGKFKLASPGQAEGIVLEYELPAQASGSYPAEALIKRKFRLTLRRQQ